MATAFSTVGSAVNRVPLRLNGTNGGAAVPNSGFLGSNLKKIVNSRITNNNKPVSFKVFAAEKEIDESKQTDKDRWRGLAYDISDDQQDITRGKGMVDSLFQAPQDAGTHYAVMNSYEYLSTGLRTYMDNTEDGFYIAPAFMDKLVVHITKNFMTLPNIKIPLILGVWGGKGQGKSFQCELVFAKMGITPIMMSAGAGRMGGTTQYTVNNQMVNATLMNIADNPTNVQLPGMYNKEENPRVPIIVTGNDFSTLYAPLIRDGRMEKFYWAPTREDRIGVCCGIFQTDGVSNEEVTKLVDTFPGQSIDFFGALRRLVNSRDGPVTFEQPKITIAKLLEYGNMLVQEQDNVKRVQLAETYLDSAALGDANKDAISQGAFYGKAAQQVQVPVPEGCTDPRAENFDPTARSDDGSCNYTL
ncbi:putative P-loop containing nucleoside triphosphate hydrolase [Helianthus annuus]|nr:putative P-loop containing nucleoside triphosphate hydrolase [Helianthus annuus]